MRELVLDELRKSLRARFPQAHQGRGVEREDSMGDGEVLGLGLVRTGELCEVVAGAGVSGISLVVECLMSGSDGVELVLVDGADGFDPGSAGGRVCKGLLWVRCRSAMEMMKAGDLLVRDGNVGLVVLDATGFGSGDLRGIGASVWWRLSLEAERSGVRVVVVSGFPLVPCAGSRFLLGSGFSLDDFDLPRGELLGRLRVVAERRKGAN